MRGESRLKGSLFLWEKLRCIYEKYVVCLGYIYIYVYVSYPCLIMSSAIVACAD